MARSLEEVTQATLGAQVWTIVCLQQKLEAAEARIVALEAELAQVRPTPPGAPA